MDNITKSYVDGFIKKLGIDEQLEYCKKFELFSSYSLLSKISIDILSMNDLESISTGDSKGVDTIAFFINDRLILNSDEINNFMKQKIDVKIFFLQSKTSNSFSDTELGAFLDVVIDFFKDEPQYNIPEFETARDIYKKLLSIMKDIKNIDINCLYVSLGDKQYQETSIDATIKIKQESLNKYNLFSNVDISLVDKTLLISEYKKADTPLHTEIILNTKIQLPPIQDVEEAYIGIIPFIEFKKLIMDNDNNKIKSLFNDNVRDFLGLDNPINEGIKETIQNGKFNEFPLLNNGITIIAESNSGKGNNLILDNYQIVNGCQTSNVLFELKHIDKIDDVFIPIKVVITKNDKLRDEIIFSTNSQSKITEEQLFATTQFQKNLEDYYYSNRDIYEVYYERRTNQYASLQITRNNIIEIKEQLKSFMAMFFDIPHLVVGNIGKVVDSRRNDFFQKDHSMKPYYISGLTSIKLGNLFNKNKYKIYKKYRYHIFMGFRYLIEDIKFDKKYLKNEKKYSIKTPNHINIFDKLLNHINDNNLFEETIKTTIDILNKTSISRHKGVYSNTILQEYKKHLEEYKSSLSRSN